MDRLRALAPWLLLNVCVLVLSIHLSKMERERLARPDTIPGLIAHLEAKGLGLHPVALGAHGWVENGVHLTRSRAGRAELQKLWSTDAEGPAWKGTVTLTSNWTSPPTSTANRCFFPTGRFAFYGDPEVIREIREALGR
jgi:hypothetical protein